MPELAELWMALSLACSAAGVVTAIAVVVSTQHGLLGLRCALELWLAAGLLRLAAEPSWTAIGVAAAIVAVRTLARAGLTAGADRPAGANRPA